MNTYQDVTNFLYSQLPAFQRVGKAAYKSDLNNTIELDKIFFHPHKHFNIIHVAGTNGKGSVSHMLTSVLMEAGYKTGLYTSPHLSDYRERIKVDGEMISEQEVIDFVNENKAHFERIKPSFFEMTVAMAFDNFAKQKVDVAVIEAGMGGRLDSTNIIEPELSIITNIGLDHTEFLGDTLEKIAVEKAGIIKKDTPVVIGRIQNKTQKVFIDTSKSLNSKIIFADQKYHCDYSMLSMNNLQILNVKSQEEIVYPELKTDLLGHYQKENIITSIVAIEELQAILNIPKEIIYKGLSNVVANTDLKGRWQILDQQPLTICDTGHNEEGIRLIVDQIKNTAFENLHFVLGTVNDKNIDTILSILPKEGTYYFTKANIPRALDENILAEKASKVGLVGERYDSVSQAFDMAKRKAKINDLIFIGGSTFVVAEVL